MVSHYKYLVVITLFSLAPAGASAPAGALAQDLASEIDVIAARAYGSCLNLAASDAESALDLAASWRDRGGGLPARHCMALATAGMGNFEAAGTELGRIAEDLRAGRGIEFSQVIERADRFLLAELYGQAGNVWMLAEDAPRAYDAFSQALAEAPGAGEQTIELLIDRSRALALAGDFEEALKDLDHAQLLSPGHVDIYIYMASAHRILDDIEAAEAAISQALNIEPNSQGAILERGNLRLLEGDNDGARADWQRVISLDPSSPVAAAARINIAALNDRR